jgi:hypothetical protein
VIGKNLAGFDRKAVPLADLDLDPSELSGDGPLSALLFQPGVLFFHLGKRWIRILGDDPTTANPGVAAAIGTDTVDQPDFARLAGGVLYFERNHQWITGVPAEAKVRLGHGWTAWSADDREWHLARATLRYSVAVPEGAQVLGVIALDGQPALLTSSPAGLLLRVVGPEHTRTLTRWSYGRPGVPFVAVHPTLPLIAVTQADGGVAVVDLAADQLLRQIEAPQ